MTIPIPTADPRESGSAFIPQLRAKLGEVDLALPQYNAKVYDAIGDGLVNDRAALNTLANTTLQVIGTGGRIYFPAGTYLINSNMTFPANVELSFDPRAMLKPANGVTITILGLVDAGPHKIFTNATAGLGIVTLGNKSPAAFPQWWGAVLDGSTDDIAPFSACITAVGTTGTPIKISNSTSGMFIGASGVLPVYSNMRIVGDGSLVKFANRSGPTSLFYTAASVTNVTFQGLRFTSMTGALPLTNGMYLAQFSGGGSNVTLRDCTFDGIYQPIKFDSVLMTNILLENLTVTEATGLGFFNKTQDLIINNIKFQTIGAQFGGLIAVIYVGPGNIRPRITNIAADGVAAGGYVVNLYGNGEDVTDALISNITVTNSDSGALDIEGGSVSGNVVNTVVYGITASAVANAVRLGVGVHGLLIDDVALSDCTGFAMFMIPAAAGRANSSITLSNWIVRNQSGNEGFYFDTGAVAPLNYNLRNIQFYDFDDAAGTFSPIRVTSGSAITGINIEDCKFFYVNTTAARTPLNLQGGTGRLKGNYFYDATSTLQSAIDVSGGNWDIVGDNRQVGFGQLVGISSTGVNFTQQPILAMTFADGATTPSVANGPVWIAANTAATTITNFTGGARTGQVLIVKFSNGNTTIQHNGNVMLRAGANLVGATDTSASFMSVNGVWYQTN